MKKILTITFIAILALAIAFVLAALLGPHGVKMERSIEISATRAAIFKNITNYTNFNQWSPWVAMDSTTKYEYYGQQGQVGAGFKWKGNDKVGEGSMQTTEIVPDSQMVNTLTFVKPFASNANASFTLNAGANGNTKVTWAFWQSFSFAQRPFMLFMNLEKMVGADYERGLAKLKKLSESATADKEGLVVVDTTWAAHTYVAYRANVGMKELGQVFQDKMPKLFQYLKKGKFAVAEPPTGLYYSWDTTTLKTNMAIAIPVTGTPKATDGYTVLTVPASKAIAVNYYGPYEAIELAHTALKKHIADKGLKVKKPAIEEYVGDPGAEKDPAKVLTKVYYLVE